MRVLILVEKKKKKREPGWMRNAKTIYHFRHGACHEGLFSRASSVIVVRDARRALRRRRKKRV